MKNKDDYCRSHGTTREVDVKAPPVVPSVFILDRTQWDTNLQLTLSVNTPPNNGPTTLATPNTAPMSPWNRGLFARGTVCIVMIIAPFIMPALPNPAMLLPKINATLLGAAPHIADPISKTRIAARNTGLGDQKV
jgi:hypothetical protein